MIADDAEFDLQYLVDSYEAIDCPICGCDDHETICQVTERINVEITCVLCRRCTHLFLNPRPTTAAYERFYHDEHYRQMVFQVKGQDYAKRKALYDAEFDVQAGRGRRLYEQYVRNVLGKDDWVFDFGCGDGSWLQGLRELTECRIDGNEPSQFDVEYIKDKLGVEIFSGSLETITDDIVAKHGNGVRLAIVSGSLQHIVDPVTCLATARTILRDEGYLYICNNDMLEMQIDKRRPLEQLIAIDHPNYFHRTSYEFMVRSAGFEIIGFQPVSTVRSGCMEIFAKKSPVPENLEPEQSFAEILKRIRDNDAYAARARTLPFRLAKNTKRAVSGLARLWRGRQP